MNRVNQDREVVDKVPKMSRRFLISIIVIAILLIAGITAYRIATSYIWMDTLNFGSIYTTILYSKVIIGLTGFIVFFILT